MTNSTNPAESLDAPSVAVSFYRWEVPEKPIAVHLSLDLIDRLERDVLESFKAITKRGSEVGGVLLGRVEPGKPATVVIEQYEPVECEYSRGPLYLLAENDVARLKEAVEKARKRNDGLTVAGFFRSNTRRELTLDEDDLALATSLFTDPNHVFLLVRPFSMKPSLGGFFIWEDGQLHSEHTYLQFPFKRSELVKTQAHSIINPGGRIEAAPPMREPLVMPKREDRPQVIAPVVLKREEPRPAPPAKRDEAPPLVFKREERTPIIPSTSRREELAGKREELAGAPAGQKRDEHPVVLPPAQKHEERLSGPTLVARREEPVLPVLRKEEKNAEKPAAPQSKREERPSVTVRREEKPSVVVVPAKSEPAASKPEEKPVAKEVEPPVAKEAEMDLGTVFRSLSLAEPAEQPRSSGRKWLFIIPAVVLAAGGGGYFAYQALNSQPPAVVQPADTSLELKVERSAGQLLLSWNRASSLIQNARRATLLITDGDHTEPVDLDLGQLRTGSIVYSPMTSDVSFRLEITGARDGKSVGESVRVLAGRPSPAVTAPQPSVAKPAPGSAEKLAAPVSTQPAAGSVAQPKPSEQPKVTAGPAVTAAPPKPESLAARLRAADLEMPAPPALEGGSSNALAASAPASSASALAPPPVQPPAPSSRPAAQAPSGPAVQQGGNAQEARLVRRLPPTYPMLARQTRISGIVRVRAVIGKDGKVRRATPVSGPPLLRQAAAEAVGRWLYSPALLNGEPVESETQVDVNFML